MPIRRLLGSILARKAPGETFFARAVKIRHEIELYTDELVFPIRGFKRFTLSRFRGKRRIVD